MGCNCKASSRIVRVKEAYGYDKPTRKNVSVGNKIKMFFQALLIWILLIILFPITLIVFGIFKIFKKDIKFLKKIKIRL